MSATGPVYYSRFQVLCAERPAWAQPALRRRTRFYYDGMRFWCHGEAGEDRLLPSWRAPRYGWVHQSGCDCRLCIPRDAHADRRLAS